MLKDFNGIISESTSKGEINSWTTELREDELTLMSVKGRQTPSNKDKALLRTTHRVLVVLKHLGFGFEVVCGWHRVFIPAVPLFQDVCVQPRLHSCIQDHLELRRLHLPRHSDAAVLFSHQTLVEEGSKKKDRGQRRWENETRNMHHDLSNYFRAPFCESLAQGELQSQWSFERQFHVLGCNCAAAGKSSSQFVTSGMWLLQSQLWVHCGGGKWIYSTAISKV